MHEIKYFKGRRRAVAVWKRLTCTLELISVGLESCENGFRRSMNIKKYLLLLVLARLASGLPSPLVKGDKHDERKNQKIPSW
jgi:hypothetical protein